MVLLDFVFAFVVAIALTIVFAGVFRSIGPWALWWLFLVLVFLAAWAGGLWLTPVGPALLGRTWVPFLIAGFLFALLLAAASPAAPRRGAGQRAPEAEAVTQWSAFLWILVLALVLAVVSAYLV